MVCVDNGNNAVSHQKMGNLLFVVTLPGQCQCDGKNEIAWLFEVILVTFFCFNVLGSSLSEYLQDMRGTPYLSIIYCGDLH